MDQFFTETTTTERWKTKVIIDARTFEQSMHLYFIDRLASKLARKDSLALKLSQRPGRQELIDRNILQTVSDEDRRIDRTAIGAKLIRRLSLRPTPEELEDRNILKSRTILTSSTLISKWILFAEHTSEELKREREEKKRYLLRKLSFRPSVDELKNRKVQDFACL